MGAGTAALLGALVAYLGGARAAGVEDVVTGEFAADYDGGSEYYYAVRAASRSRPLNAATRGAPESRAGARARRAPASRRGDAPTRPSMRASSGLPGPIRHVRCAQDPYEDTLPPLGVETTVNMTCKATRSRRFELPYRGVSLGGWMVLEPWLTPSLFYQFLGTPDVWGNDAPKHTAGRPGRRGAARARGRAPFRRPAATPRPNRAPHTSPPPPLRSGHVQLLRGARARGGQPPAAPPLAVVADGG